MLPALAACRTTATDAIEPRWECLAFQPILWSAKDTAGTVRQISEHNAAWDALCAERPTGRR